MPFANATTTTPALAKMLAQQHQQQHTNVYSHIPYAGIVVACGCNRDILYWRWQMKSTIREVETNIKYGIYCAFQYNKWCSQRSHTHINKHRFALARSFWDWWVTFASFMILIVFKGKQRYWFFSLLSYSPELHILTSRVLWVCHISALKWHWMR